MTVGTDSFIETELGRIGHAVYGRYQRRQPGRYVVAVTMELTAPCDGTGDRVCAIIDVTSEYGRLIHAWRRITVGDLRGGRTAIALPFGVREAAEFEYRVEVLGEAPLRIAETRDLFLLSVSPAQEVAAKAFPTLASGSWRRHASDHGQDDDAERSVCAPRAVRHPFPEDRCRGA